MKALLLLCLLILGGYTGSAWAQQNIALDQARELTVEAANLLKEQGIDAARRTFHAPGKFRHDEIYVNVIDANGTWLVYPPNPKNEGKSVLNVRDADGKLLVQEIIRVAREEGEGWVEYRWLNPATNAIEPKATFVRHVPERGLIAYVGIYR